VHPGIKLLDTLAVGRMGRHEIGADGPFHPSRLRFRHPFPHLGRFSRVVTRFPTMRPQV